jgi:DNA-binding MarR family transcriptional regulator
MAATRVVHDDLGYLLGQATHAFSREFDVHLRDAGLSPIEWRVLATLHAGGPLGVSQLAQQVIAKQPTVTKLVQRMNEQGWVRLQADPSDQRRTLVEATSAGKRLVRPLLVRARAHESEQLRTLRAGEQVALKKLLVKLARGAA